VTFELASVMEDYLTIPIKVKDLEAKLAFWLESASSHGS